MNDEPVPARGPDLGRWLLVAALILIGIFLYFWFAPSSRPVAAPTVQEGS
ncbi:MAG: hypothetical protein ACREMX_03395 [Gemmatimonadales bacterium]